MLATACLFLLSLAVATPPARAASEPQRVTSATEIVTLWSPSQHLYVKGDIGVSDGQLRELETWLTQRPHWTVVLLESAQGERFVDAAGISYENIAAVQHALGKGLSNRTNFGSLKHPETGEPDGAIFLLSVRDRNLSYFGSEAQDRRGLGNANWKGQLDAPAIAAMRSGGRILDAVRDTVTSIDERLAARLEQERADRERAHQQELAERERALAERESARASMRDRLHLMPAELDALAVRRQQLFGGSPPPGVPQVNPDSVGLRVKATRILALLEPARGSKRQKPRDPKAGLEPDPRFDQAKSAFEELRATLDGLRFGFELYELGLSRLKKAEEALAALETHRLKAFAAPELAEARAALEQARASVLSLRPNHQTLLDTAQDSRTKLETLLTATARHELRLGELTGLLDALEKDPHAEAVQQDIADVHAVLRKAREAFARQDRSYTEPLRWSESAYQQAHERLAAARSRAAMYRMFAGIAAVAAVIALLLVRNRRNQHMRKAAELHAQWRKALDEKMQALFALLDRTHLAAGHSREEIQKRYSGTTRERALALASEVDELFLLSVGASRVLAQAEELLTGKGALDWVAAQLTASRFVRVTRLLRDEPIAFHPDEGIELVLRGRPTAEQRLIGDLASYQPFSLSFEALIEAFSTRAGNVLPVLDALEAAPGQAGEGIAALERLITEVRTAEPAAVAIRVPALLERVVPSLEALLAEARSLLVEDPIGAFHGPLAGARQQGADTSALLSVLARGRSEVLPLAERAGKALVAAGFSRQWLDETIDTLTRQADEVARALVTCQADEDVKALGEALVPLERRAAEAGSLVEMSGRARTGLTRVKEEIETARAGLGQALGLTPGSMLREQGRDPSERISSGEQSLVKGREALSLGELETARTGLEAALARVSEAVQLVSRSREVHARFEPWCQEFRAEARRLAGLVAERQAPLTEAMRRYLPSALSLRADDPVRPKANGTVQDNLREVAAHSQRAAELLQSASNLFSQGRLLAAADRLAQVREQQVLAAHRLDELTEKVRRLQAAEASNPQLLSMAEALAAACAVEVADVRVMAPTQSTLETARGLVEAARARVGVVPGDPLEVAERLSAASQALTDVQRSAANDHSLHARAEESLRTAQSALAGAQVLVRRAETDGIADSRETTRAMKAIAALGGALEKANGTFGVPHGDWLALAAEGERIEAHAAREAATLRDELAAAERAVQAIQQAADPIKRAKNWHESYGVTIRGNPGSQRLTEARTALHAGNYASAQQAAENAGQLALVAIAQAEQLVVRYVEEERRREEERERERERERDSSSSNSSSFFSSSSDSSSSDSGFSSSSWSSSDSSSSGGSSNDSGFGSSSW